MFTNKSNGQQGFSLLEISLALGVMAVLLYGVANTLNYIDDFETYQKNQQYLEKVEKSLYTFIQVNRFLPCPDTSGNGRENRKSDISCRRDEGALPYLDLGVDRYDAWGEELYYSVNRRADDATRIVDDDESASFFNNSIAPQPSYDYNTPPFGSARGAGNYRVCSESAGLCTGTTPTADVVEFAAIAVVVSFGKNAGDTWFHIENGTQNQLGIQEFENADGDGNFWQARGNDDLSGQYFDDQLIWITGYDMKNAVVKSGGALPDIP